MNRKVIGGAVFEALVRQAVIDNYDRELDDIPPREELESMFSFSDRHEAMMKALFCRDARRVKAKKVADVSKRMAAGFVLAVAVLFGLLMTSTTVRAAVGDTLVEFFDQFVSIRYQGEAEPDLASEWEPEYLPEGFTFQEKETLAAVVALTYRNDNGVIMTLDYSTAPRNVVYSDNEYTGYTSVYRDGTEYRILEAESNDFSTKIMWEEEKYYFILASKHDSDELLNTALSVQKK